MFAEYIVLVSLADIPFVEKYVRETNAHELRTDDSIQIKERVPHKEHWFYYYFSNNISATWFVGLGKYIERHKTKQQHAVPMIYTWIKGHKSKIAHLLYDNEEVYCGVKGRSSKEWKFSDVLPKEYTICERCQQHMATRMISL